MAAGPGCLAGDTEIVTNRGGNGRRVRLDDLVTLFNGGEVPIRRNGRDTKGRRRWDARTDTYVECEIDGYLRSGKLLNAWCSGIKTTYLITTDTGRWIRASEIHPFKTVEGWRRVNELQAGDRVLVRGERTEGGRAPKKRYKTIKLANHPNRTGKKRIVPVHRLVAEAGLNGFSYEEWVSEIRSGRSLNAFTFLTAQQHVHHKDENHLNNDPSNLEILAGKDHLRHHAEVYGSNVLHKARYESIVSIERHGEEMTYDLELETDPHNFTANGFVVHNTGKSAFTLTLALKAMVPAFYLSADSDAFTQLTRSISVEKRWDLEKSAQAVLDNDAKLIGDAVGSKPIRFSYRASPTLDNIEASMAAYEEVYGDFPSLTVIDNVTNVRADSGNGEDDPFSGLESLMDYFNTMARETESCVVGLHHVTGSYNDADKPIPLSGVKGQITRVPSMVLTLYRVPGIYPGDPDTLYVSTVKNRTGQSDPSGNSPAELEFFGNTMTIRDKKAGSH